jgi:hypothetical protein
MQPLLLDALYAVGLGRALEAIIELLLGMGVLGVFSYFIYLWVQAGKEHERNRLASGIQWSAAETQARLERKKGRRRVWIAVVIVGAILASYPW